jgi:hypothetical protein
MDLTIELTDISDPYFTAAFCLARAKQKLICDRCEDSAEPVVAVLEVRELDTTWALCGLCTRELPAGFQGA